MAVKCVRLLNNYTCQLEVRQAFDKRINQGLADFIIKPLQQPNSLICSVTKQLEPKQRLLCVWVIFKQHRYGIFVSCPIKKQTNPFQITDAPVTGEMV